MQSVAGRAGFASIAAVGLAGLILLSGLAEGSGSGYNLSYTASANSSIIPAVDLVQVSTSYAGGPNLTATLTLAGTPLTNNAMYSYVWLFGGATTNGATAWAFVENGSAYLHSIALGLPESIGYSVAGPSLSISVNITLVGSSVGFTFNGEASQGDSSNTSTYSFLGTDYPSDSGCTGSNCGGNTGGTGGSSASSSIPIGEILWPIVIVVVVVVVVVLLVRRRRPPAVAPA